MQNEKDNINSEREPEPWRNLAWVAEYLNVCEKTVRRHEAELGAVLVGSLRRFKVSEIDRRLNEKRLDSLPVGKPGTGGTMQPLPTAHKPGECEKGGA